MINYINQSVRITEDVRKSFKSVDCKMTNRDCYGYDTTFCDITTASAKSIV